MTFFSIYCNWSYVFGEIARCIMPEALSLPSNKDVLCFSRYG